MIEAIRSIQRERAENVLTDMYIEHSIESGKLADLFLEGQVDSEKDIFGDDALCADCEEDEAIAKLIDALPEDADDSEILDKIISSDKDVTLDDLV